MKCSIRTVAAFWSIPCAHHQATLSMSAWRRPIRLIRRHCWQYPCTWLSGRARTAMRCCRTELPSLKRSAAPPTGFRSSANKDGFARRTYPHVLYGLLESSVVQVTAPHGGVFHPKIWVLRFKRAGHVEDVVLRVLILSRNLTGDRSWDLSLS